MDEPADRTRVVIVDDHDLLRRGLRDFLGDEEDLEVVGEAADARGALDLLARLAAVQRLPHVVLMDLLMRPVDGVETTRLIRSRYEDVCVVALTSSPDEDRFRAALDAGVSGYVLKSAAADDVAGALRAARHGQVQLDGAVMRRLLSSLTSRAEPGASGSLTQREREILRLVALGKANKAIAAELGISEQTARTHVSSILAKLGVASRTQAALWAIREGVADAP
jgi:DNA-binding NarL/FixJ family response regulator